MDSDGYFIRSWRNPMDCIIVVGFRPQRGTTMTPVPKELDKRTVWKAEITQNMLNHLTSAQQQELRGRLSLAVDTIAAEYKVGREFERELRTTA